MFINLLPSSNDAVLTSTPKDASTTKTKSRRGYYFREGLRLVPMSLNRSLG